MSNLKIMVQNSTMRETGDLHSFEKLQGRSGDRLLLTFFNSL